MPWHNPGSLNENMAWDLTAHVLELNGYEDIPELNAKNGKDFKLAIAVSTATSAPQTSTTTVKATKEFIPLVKSTPTDVAPAAKNKLTWWMGGIALAIIAGLIVILLKGGRKI